MPIYEYVCPKCSSRFELLRSMSQANEDAPCPQCQQKAKRVLSVFAGLARNGDGLTSSLGGGSCGGCSATGCDSCSI
ncbi:MAG: zinc ribbon domain-containing protein [Dehalococcoidales bacterium]|nr:zinc ribbon domain-containing protein [Dehalococcoidales bacterium]